MEKKLLVGGYLDDRIFRADEDILLYDKDIDCYTVEEALKLGFMSGIEEFYYEDFKKGTDLEFFELSNKEKLEIILKFVEDDEIANLEYFDTEEKALARKNEELSLINEYNQLVDSGKFTYSYAIDSPYEGKVNIYTISNV